jgi:GMP synthase (glutamine-hydrolysing)
MADEERRLYAVQFHPEVAHTPQGKTILDNFLEVCGVSRTWSMAGLHRHDGRRDPCPRCRVEVCCAPYRRGRLVSRSGAGASRHRRSAHVRLRGQRPPEKGRGEAVVHTFRDTFKMNLIHVDASERFLSAIQGVTDPR